MALDIRPRLMECAVTGEPAPDIEDGPLQVAFPPNEADPDLQAVLRHLPVGWVYVRAYRVVEEPGVGRVIEQMEAHIDATEEQMRTQGATDDQVNQVIEQLEDQIPDPALTFERTHTVIGPGGAATLDALGLGFPDDDGEGGEFAIEPGIGEEPEERIDLSLGDG